MKKGLVLLCCLLLIGVTACSNEEQTNHEESKEQMIERVLQEGNYIMLDVRTKEEYEESHIKGAINIPYDEIESMGGRVIMCPKYQSVFNYQKELKRIFYLSIFV